MNSGDAAGVVAAWMASPGHRADILKAEFSEAGVGIARGIACFCRVFASPA